MRVRTAGFADLLERDGEALVLLPDGAGLVRLSAVGAATVELAVNGIDLDALAGSLEHRFGPPPEGSAGDLTARLVTELVDQGVLRLTALPGDPGRHWRINDDAAFVLTSPERVVALNLGDPTIGPRALLGTAAAVWLGLVGEGDHLRPWIAETDLLSHLATAYGTDADALEPDVTALLDDLLTAGLVSTSPWTPTSSRSS